MLEGKQLQPWQRGRGDVKASTLQVFLERLQPQVCVPESSRSFLLPALRGQEKESERKCSSPLARSCKDQKDRGFPKKLALRKWPGGNEQFSYSPEFLSSPPWARHCPHFCLDHWDSNRRPNASNPPGILFRCSWQEQGKGRKGMHQRDIFIFLFGQQNHDDSISNTSNNLRKDQNLANSFALCKLPVFR